MQVFGSNLSIASWRQRGLDLKGPIAHDDLEIDRLSLKVIIGSDFNLLQEKQ